MARFRKTTKFDIRQLCERPNIFVIDNFLTGRECATLIRMAQQQGLECGTFIPYGKNKNLIEEDKSCMTAFENGANKLISRIEARIENITRIPVTYGERLKVVFYRIGAQVTPHHDFTRDRTSIVRDRVAQVLIYLNDVEQGGETSFPNAGIKVIPKRGRALFWYNVFGMTLPDKTHARPKTPSRLKHDDYSLHGGEPVVKGEKWIACKFLHPKPFFPATLTARGRPDDNA